MKKNQKLSLNKLVIARISNPQEIIGGGDDDPKTTTTLTTDIATKPTSGIIEDKEFTTLY